MRPARPVSALIAVAGAAAAAVLLLSGCTPGPAPQPVVTSTGDPSPGETVGVPTPGSSVTPTISPSSHIELPTRCEDIYSPDMLRLLNDQNPPLNDPGVTMSATEIPAALELIESGAPTLRCSWGVPSEVGLATNVTVLDEAEREALLVLLEEEGLACEEDAGGTLCRISRDEQMATFGESHFVRGNGWIATHWINFDPFGYTEDIAATLWS